MTTIAAWCAGMTVLTWAKKEKWAWLPWMAATLPSLVTGVHWQSALTAILTLLLLFNDRKSPKRQTVVSHRWALVRFWQEVQVLFSAGLTFWQAVEISAASEPAITHLLTAMAEQITLQPSVAVKNVYWPGEDGDLTLMLLQHGYMHGITDQQIRSHVRHIEGRLRLEEEVRRRRDPLWMTILPAFLLVNVLWVFVVPMISMAHQSWLHF